MIRFGARHIRPGGRAGLLLAALPAFVISAAHAAEHALRTDGQSIFVHRITLYDHSGEVVDPRKEKNAVREAGKLGITTVALIDTDCDPDLIDLPIPGNDDGIRSVDIIMRILADAVLEGKASTVDESQAKAEGAEAEPPASNGNGQGE